MLPKFIRSFFRRENGNVALIVTIVMLPMVLSAGAAIDFVRAHLAKTSLQQAVDAAGLAGGANPDAEDSEVLDLAQNFLDSNADGLVIDLVNSHVEPVVVDGVRQVNVTATADLETIFLRLININTLDVTIDTSVQRREAGPVHVALVVDVTQSMAERPAAGGSKTKIESLKEAATNLVNTLMTAKNPDLQMAVVPYAGYVKVRWGSAAKTLPFEPWIKPWEHTDPNACTSWQLAPANCSPKRRDCEIEVTSVKW